MARVSDSRGGVGWAEGVADRIIRRYTRERPGWVRECESMKHLKLVVIAELLREERGVKHGETVVGGVDQD